MSHVTCRPSATSTLARESELLRRALGAVDGVARALSADPTSDGLGQAMRSARATVASLPAGLAATTMSRLLETVEDCRRTGLHSCARLTAQRGAVARAVRLALRPVAG